jgi:phage terminase large subunit GpA-like protein
MGDTSTEAPWRELDKVLNETWTTAAGNEVQIRMLTVDSGYNTQHVYDWVRSKPADRVRAVKGSDSLQMAFGQPKDIDVSRDGSRLRRTSKVWPVGVSIIKSELYGYLKLDGAGDNGVFASGFCHYPQYDEEYFKRLCSEQLVKKTVNGRTVYRWIKIHERNEPLDCRIYARAAAAMFGIDRFHPHDWDQLEGKHEVKKPVVKQPVATPAPAPTERDKGGSKGYWDRQNQRKKKFW